MLRSNVITIKAIQRQERANAALRTSPITIPQKPARVYEERIAKYTVNIAKFEYPLSYLLSGDYTVADIMNEPVHATTLHDSSPRLFPRAVAQWIWGSVPRERGVGHRGTGAGRASPVQKLEASFMSIQRPSHGSSRRKAASWRRQ